MENTFKLQNGVRGHRALWDHIISVSVADMKRNYEKLNVEFDLWNGESTVQYLLADMVEEMKKGGYAYESEGALVVLSLIHNHGGQAAGTEGKDRYRDHDELRL